MVRINHIPKDWQPNNPEAVANWMAKLPNVYDLESVIANDKKWQTLKQTKL